ncbi:TIGR00341 family protein [Flavobacterium kingsejongi]|uniref:TIGR00341 family protein n=1 Tax=Flavobacterium kingsejongi TaxID=1678728 RepID=A0A2S1LSM2_9FLAO|nr:TIGR00341 family protein [Flavobacterium kingsejongi]AWG26688.1 TIGR00341 family protein [Flavobacterium kingsejongi]
MNRIFDFINLHSGEENRQKVLENVKANTSFRGSNLWILACAIVIASVGLNVNSTAVIIGAMLISPLMGPIIGAGFGLGIFDFQLLKKSLKNLLIATIVSLVVSTLYFYLSPFKETQTELLARTSPNIYDVLIAFFGGLVGVIAITRVEKGNPIPGVAIATALMPPLCTAGYGLAIGNFKFFFGAMYLYTINCVFICIATFIIVKYLNYPKAALVDQKNEKRVQYAITILTLVMVLPSIYFANQLFQQKKYTQKTELFLEQEFTDKGYTILYEKTKFNQTPKAIELVFLSKKFTDSEIEALNRKLKDYDITDTQLLIRQDTTDLKKDILRAINSDKLRVNEKDIVIDNLKKELEAKKYDTKGILAEMKILFPGIDNIAISDHVFNPETDSVKTVPVLIYKGKKALTEEARIKLEAWLEQKLSKEKVVVYKEIAK